MHFGENQLSRSLIGLSPLPTAHPPGFQPWWVRSSTRSYPRFNLAMGRSLRFGSRACDSDALFGLAFATASPHGTCPLSVTREYLGLGGGPPRFARDFSGPVLLGNTLRSSRHFVYGGVTLCAGPFQALRL